MKQTSFSFFLKTPAFLHRCAAATLLLSNFLSNNTKLQVKGNHHVCCCTQSEHTIFCVKCNGSIDFKKMPKLSIFWIWVNNFPSFKMEIKIWSEMCKSVSVSFRQKKWLWILSSRKIWNLFCSMFRLSEYILQQRSRRHGVYRGRENSEGHSGTHCLPGWKSLGRANITNSRKLIF